MIFLHEENTHKTHLDTELRKLQVLSNFKCWTLSFINMLETRWNYFVYKWVWLDNCIYYCNILFWWRSCNQKPLIPSLLNTQKSEY